MGFFDRLLGWNNSNSIKIVHDNNTTQHVSKYLDYYSIIINSNINFHDEFDGYTIAHEFGHILGFPDCYIEYWDDKKESFVYFSLDQSDFMCAYANKASDKRIEELVKKYSELL